MIERKIGERFIDDGVLMECRKDENNIFACCAKEGQFCKYYGYSNCKKQLCLSTYRTDGKAVCFIEVKED